jgi:phosphoesterase RecJ-like protein
MFFEDIKKLEGEIKTSETIAIVGHKNPDLDSFGSVLGLARLIEINFGIKPICIYDGNIPDYMDNFPGRDNLIFAEKLPDKIHYDLLICVDLPNPDRQFGDWRAKVFKNSDFIAKIDHHPDSQKFADINIDDSAAAAACEIIYDMAKELNWKIDIDAAELFMAGIIGDTGRFKWARRGNVLRDAAEFVDMGVSIEDIHEKANVAPLKHILAEGRILAASEIYGDLAIAVVTHDDYKKLDGKANDVLEMLHRVKGIEYIALMTEAKEQQIHISFRSKSKPVNIIAAEKFKGGGHAYAAAVIVYDTLDVAKKLVMKTFGKQPGTSNQEPK